MFKRYNDVSFLLSTLDMSEMPGFITTLFEELQEEKLWYVWNHLAFRDEDFEPFKNRVKENPQPGKSKKVKIEQEELEGINVANQILGWEGAADGTI